jgi:hypothetical protein
MKDCHYCKHLKYIKACTHFGNCLKDEFETYHLHDSHENDMTPIKWPYTLTEIMEKIDKNQDIDKLKKPFCSRCEYYKGYRRLRERPPYSFGRYDR